MPSAPGSRVRHWRSYALSLLVVAVAVAVALGAWALTDRRVTASARLVLTTPTSLDQLGTSAVTDSVFARYAKQRAVFATSDSALAAVSAQVGVSLNDLRDEVTVDPAGGGAVLLISAKAKSAELAVQIANAVLAVYQQQSLQQAQQRTAAVIAIINDDKAAALKGSSTLSPADQARIGGGYDNQILSAQIAQAKFGDGVTLADQASVDNVDQPSGPWLALGIGLVVGLVLAGLLVWLRGRRDHGIWSAHRAGDLIEAPLFGEVPPSRTDPLDPFEAPAPAYSSVWAGAQERISGGVVLVTGPGRSIGRTSIALQLAAAAGQDGHHVLLVDATRSRSLSECFDLHDVPTGFETLVAGGVTLARTTFQVIVGDSGTAWIIPAGEAAALPLGTHRGQATARVIEELRTRFDLIIIDTEDELESPVTTALSKSSDHVLLVVRVGTDAERVELFLRRLNLHGLQPDGFVFTHAGRGRRTARSSAPEDDEIGSPLERITENARSGSNGRSDPGDRSDARTDSAASTT
ncbi:MAG: hypothetical protein ACTHMS_04780 [Jatrophihabitans sp.]|uniref:hypothetical protein n=1 Tax=Jatrophihabitans sp. TaxID=1932789 RepID=UPI003F805C7C